MSSRDSARVVDGLRANLRAAGIPVCDEDIEKVVAEGYPGRVLALREALAALGGNGVPDALSGWMPGEADAGGEWGGAGLAAGEAPASAGGEGDPVSEGGRRASEPIPIPDPAGDRTVRVGRDAADPSSRHRGPGGWPSTIAELAPLVRAGAVSPVEIAEQALTRIEEEDGRANAFQLVLAEEARAAARRAEEEVARGAWRGPLHGIPVAVKDLLAMENTVTTAGSKILADRVTDHDAAAVERLREAGAVIVGKTRLSEFAYWPGSTNPHYGPTPNPHDPTRDAGGSSSGSAAAVARGMVYAALGTDTGGSIRIPAALCGVVGLKPTFGRVSLHGCAPLAWSLDHVGPLARGVEDAALVLAAIAGPDPRDGRTRGVPPFAASGAPGDPAGGGRRLRGGLTGLRVGVPRDLYLGAPLPDAVMRSWTRANRALERAGASLLEVDLGGIPMLRQVAIATLGIEAAAAHAPSLRAHYDDYGAFCRGRLVAAISFTAADFLGAQRLRHRIRARWDAACRPADLLSLPCQPSGAPRLDKPASTDLTNLFNALGWPAISVPCGTGEHGLPLAVQLVAKPWDEATLVLAARAVEA